jgi:hypothetical protein
MIAGLRRRKIVLMNKKCVRVQLSDDLLMDVKRWEKIKPCVFLILLHIMRDLKVLGALFLKI